MMPPIDLSTRLAMLKLEDARRRIRRMNARQKDRTERAEIARVMRAIPPAPSRRKTVA